MSFISKLLLIIVLGCFSLAGMADNGTAQVDLAAGQGKAQACTACHGEGGNAIVPAWPKLAGQWPGYLMKQMWDFKNGEKGPRNNAVMFGIMTSLTSEDIVNLAAYFSTQAPLMGVAINDKTLARGEILYRGGDRNKGIPACSACHGPQGEGNPLANFPRLSGQNTPYTVQQLQAFREGSRHNDINHTMRDIAARMSSQDMEAVANYISGLH